MDSNRLMELLQFTVQRSRRHQLELAEARAQTERLRDECRAAEEKMQQAARVHTEEARHTTGVGVELGRGHTLAPDLLDQPPSSSARPCANLVRTGPSLHAAIVLRAHPLTRPGDHAPPVRAGASGGAGEARLLARCSHLPVRDTRVGGGC